MFRLIAALSVLCLVSGEGMKDRVVNGRTAMANEFPYQVSLQQNGNHFCGGSILNERWILTAAHCVLDIIQANELNSVMVRAGTSNYKSGGVFRPVEAGIVHEKYNTRSMDYDVALLLIFGIIPMSASIKPVKIPTSPIKSGASVTVSGWGQLSDRNTNLPLSMQAVDMAHLSRQDCARWHGGAVTDSMICAMAPGIDACRGDSGGPLCLTDTFVQVGVVSWGIRCADAGLPGVYADLTNKIIVGFLERYVGKLL